MGNSVDTGAALLRELALPDRYELLRHIANGGMASVWCAEDRLLGRRVAIKLLAEPFAHDHAAVRRFKREARVAARLAGHPHVVTIYDVGEASAPDGGPGRPLIVMEYLPGGTVADALRVGAASRKEALRWLHEAAAALDYAHAKGVLHRDVKLVNLLLDCDRMLHVADFGIAHLGSEDTLTATGQFLGTAAYLAPERALGQAATAASDRYSLAVAAFELLVGQRPFTAGHFAAQARQHIEDPPPRASRLNPALPAEIDAVLSRGMAKTPESRWPTAGAFADALEAALTETAVSHAVPRRRRAPRSLPCLQGGRPGPQGGPSRSPRWQPRRSVSGSPRVRLTLTGRPPVRTRPCGRSDRALDISRRCRAPKLRGRLRYARSPARPPRPGCLLRPPTRSRRADTR